jgi:ABC-type transporter Mla subunit MlaD
VLVSAGDWALVVLAVFLAVMAIAVGALSVKLFQLLGVATAMVDGMRDQTVALLGDARTTVGAASRNLEESERLVSSVANITGTVERITRLFEMAVETPLIKVISASYGSAAALRRFRGET